MARVKSQKSQKRRKTFVRFLPIYILMLPGLIYLFINNYMPLPGLVIAFKQYNAGKGIYGSPWVGLKNFEYLFTTSDAFVITRNTISIQRSLHCNQYNTGNRSSYCLE